MLNLALGVLLYRVAGAIRQEQLQGTLESLLATPTATATVQIGSVASTLLMVPLRATLTLGAIALVFGLHFDPGGIVPAALIVAALVPFAWGLGLATGAAIVTFRRGTGLLGAGTTLLGLASGAVFPLALLPAWLAAVAEWNPLAIAIDGVREALLGGAGWSEALADIAVLLPLSAVTLAARRLPLQARARPRAPPRHARDVLMGIWEATEALARPRAAPGGPATAPPAPDRRPRPPPRRRAACRTRCAPRSASRRRRRSPSRCSCAACAKPATGRSC